MRVWGRLNSQWVAVTTAPNGDNTNVYITALIQYLKLNWQESPMWGTSGIPARQAVNSQIPPDYYAQLAQQRYAPYFASVLITRSSSNPPTYQVNILTKTGAVVSRQIAK